ncbi:MAG: 1-acyl-sn-glycerol-3-phosphate acyltransferase [Thermoguttaceae bacterium]|nr:1-acyl-sn-glycerol-3-phosphate acyltransferase [Thermoguttaceae bacterium]MBR4752953.1 1-acyl-sn-glycerol-3-phosphate acyltransferase [Thermoguttaceae bacterium]MBR5759321.1 1-acyl-sn-glycerol-3-phosphate acyltransferase [Thermoguttaceae bacterium]
MITWLARNILILLAKLVSGVSVRWVGCRPDGDCQRVYFANHTSHLDGIVIWAALPHDVRSKTRLVAAQDYWLGGPVRRFLALRVLNVILVDRENVSKRNNPLYRMLDEMGDRYSIIIFPEGGRSTTGVVEEFKSGVFYLVKKKPELELIPVYLDNMNRILPKGVLLPVPLLSRAFFGSPIWYERNENKEAFLERARNSVLDLKKFSDNKENREDNSETKE